MTAAPSSVALVVRESSGADRNFIMDTWVRSYDQIMPPRENTHGGTRWQWIRRCAESCLTKYGAGVIELESSPGIILGWVCGSTSVTPHELHFFYVRREARHQGLGAELLTALFGKHPSDVRGVRMTSRPAAKHRFKYNALGWQWKPLRLEEL